MHPADQAVKIKQMNIAWLSASITFTMLLIIGVYVAKVIRTANGDLPPWQAVAAFDLIVIALARLALLDKFGLRKKRTSK